MNIDTRKLKQKISQEESCAFEFLKMAKQDLKASKILYRNHLYPEAIFFLQQSVEKGYKAYHLLFTLENTENDTPTEVLSIRKIGHKTTKIFEKQASDMEDRLRNIQNKINLLPNAEEIFNSVGINFPMLIQQFSDAKKEYSSISTNQGRIKKIHLDELDKSIEKLRTIIKQSDRIVRAFHKAKFDEYTIEKMKEQSLRIANPFIQNCSEEERYQHREKINQLFGPDFSKIEPILKIIIQNRAESGCINTLYSRLSVIIQPHESSSRYPRIKYSPLEEYNRNHPLIRRFYSLVRFVEIANRKFDNLLLSVEI